MANIPVFPAMDPHGFAQGQPQHQLPLHTSTYHSADGTQAFAVDEYGRHWQLPPAPKLTSAAARGWAYPPHSQFSMMMPYTAPWTAPSTLHQQGLTHHHHQTPVGHQQHFDIEQQMMLQHHLVKSQHRRSVPQLPPPRSQSAHRAPPSSFHYRMQDSRVAPPIAGVMANNGSRGVYAEQSRLYTAASRQEIDWSQSCPRAEYCNSQISYAQPLDPYARNVYDLRQSYLQPGPAMQDTAQSQVTQATAPSSTHFAPHAPMYATWQGADHLPAVPIGERRRSEFTGMSGPTGVAQDGPWPAPHQQPPKYGSPTHNDSLPHQAVMRGTALPVQAHNRNHSVGRSQSQRRAHWATRVDQQQQQHDVQQQERQRHPSQESGIPKILGTPISQDAGPTPPSPSTLDRSGVCISNFGAEIIWHACIGLLEPQLIVEAHRDGSSDGLSPTSASSMSSPMLSTPLTTPQPPSPESKDLEASAKLLSNLGIDYNLSFKADADVDAGASRWPGWSIGPQNIVSRPSRPIADSKNSASPEVLPASEQSSPSCPGVASHLEQSAARPLSSPLLLSSSTSSPSPRQSDYGPQRFSGRNISGSRSGLGRTKSQERSRTAVIAVLALVSPRWQWSHADASLPTLSEQSQKSFEIGRRQELRNPASPRDGAPLALPSAVTGSESSPAFRRFAHQVLAQTLLSPTAFLLGLLFALRVSLIAVDSSGNIDPEAVEVLATPPSAAPFKLFTLGLMMANKHLDDNTFLNKTWNEVTGIPLVELNKMEQFFLIRCNYEIALPDRVWISFLQRVKRREEAKLVAYNLCKARQHQPVGHGRSAFGSPSHSKDEESQKVLSTLAGMLSAVGVGGGLHTLDLQSSSAPQNIDDDIDCITSKQHKACLTQGRSASLQPIRPTAALVDHHQQCQSAPSGAMQYGRREARPLNVLPSHSLQPQRPLYDSLARSLSDFATAASSSSATASRPSSRTHSRLLDAPLAPSALLELLNSGRNLTSAH